MTGDRAGQVTPAVADLGHSRLDLTRPARIGLPEAVFAAGK